MYQNTFLKIKESNPMLVSAKQAIQFGLRDPKLVLRRATFSEQSLLELLRKGCPYESLCRAAKDLGLTDEELESFLTKLQPVIRFKSKNTTSSDLALDLYIDSTSAMHLANSLRQNGCTILTRRQKPKGRAFVKIVLDRYYPKAIKHRELLFRGIPTLPIVCEDNKVIIAPVITSIDQYDSYAFLQQWHSDEDYSYHVSQVCHKDAGTETKAVMSIVAAIVSEQLKTFYFERFRPCKAFLLSLESDGGFHVNSYSPDSEEILHSLMKREGAFNEFPDPEILNSY